jgi:hypothetical protein
MADSVPKRGKGRPPGKTDAGKVAFRLPKDHFEYLEHLVTGKRRLGDTVNDAARFILIRELDAMLKDDYHNKDFSPGR